MDAPTLVCFACLVIPRDSVLKGTTIMIPIWNINRSTDLWGPDAAEFKLRRLLSPSW